MRILLVLALLLQMPLAMADGLFGKNKMDDSFAVKTIDGRQATLDGTPKDLKAGDTLYSTKSPFHFTVTAVKGNSVTISLPDSYELKTGQALLRFPTESIKKNIDTESKLKQALE